MAYKLNLTQDDVDTIGFVGHRYAWSTALSCYEPGDNSISEPEAWELKDAFEADAEGGHSMFPMLDHQSELAEKLFRFWESIV